MGKSEAENAEIFFTIKPQFFPFKLRDFPPKLKDFLPKLKIFSPKLKNLANPFVGVAEKSVKKKPALLRKAFVKPPFYLLLQVEMLLTARCFFLQ